MKKFILSILIISLVSTVKSFSQKKADTAKKTVSFSIHDYNTNHEYIFDANTPIYESTEVGIQISQTPITAEQGFTFNVKAVDATSGRITIQFLPFKDSVKNKIYSKKKWFLLNKADMVNSCSDNTDVSKWTVNYGALVIPIKIRPTKSIFTSSLNLGSSVYFQDNVTKNFADGFVVGLSLSSVTLDSLSTNGKIKSNTDRPAITPSLSYVASFKNISLIVGLGTDFINKTSTIEKSWIFNGKPWIGIGIGINLFTSSPKDTGNTVPTGSQETKPVKASTPNK